MDPEIRKKVMRMFSYGLYLLTVRSGQEVAASTVTWVSQASFDPLRIMLAVNRDSRSHALLETAGTCALLLVGDDQQEMAAMFFKAPVLENGNIGGYPFHDGEASGAPILDAVPAWLEAKVVGRVEGGDHSVIVADVIGIGIQDPEAGPLALGDTPWHYGG